MATEVMDLPPRRTLNGLFDGYCKVCWNAVYVLWVDKEDHRGVCIFGHTRAVDCPDAMGRAKTTAALAKLRAEGKLPPLRIPTAANPFPEEPEGGGRGAVGSEGGGGGVE